MTVFLLCLFSILMYGGPPLLNTAQGPANV